MKSANNLPFSSFRNISEYIGIHFVNHYPTNLSRNNVFLIQIVVSQILVPL